jgi:hypothetical protein
LYNYKMWKRKVLQKIKIIIVKMQTKSIKCNLWISIKKTLLQKCPTFGFLHWSIFKRKMFVIVKLIGR